MKSTIVKTIFLIVSVKFLIATVAAQSNTMSSSAGIEVKMNRKDDKTFSVELSGNGPQYIALGLSKDSSMGGDAVIVCTDSSVQTYINPIGTHIAAQKLNWLTGTPSNSKSSKSNGKIACSFDLPSSIDAGSGITFNLNTIDNGDLHVLVAQGQTTDSGIAAHEHSNNGRSVGLIKIQDAAASGSSTTSGPDPASTNGPIPATGPAPKSGPTPDNGPTPTTTPTSGPTPAPGTPSTSSNLKPIVILYSIVLYFIVL